MPWPQKKHGNSLFPVAELVSPPPLLPNITRVFSLKILGVTFFSRLSVADHVQNVVSFCAPTVHPLRLLRVQRYRWSGDMSSSPDCCTRPVPGGVSQFHYRRWPATHRGFYTPCASRIPQCGWTDSYTQLVEYSDDVDQLFRRDTVQHDNIVTFCIHCFPTVIILLGI